MCGSRRAGMHWRSSGGRRACVVGMRAGRRCAWGLRGAWTPRWPCSCRAEGGGVNPAGVHTSPVPTSSWSMYVCGNATDRARSILLLSVLASSGSPNLATISSLDSQCLEASVYQTSQPGVTSRCRLWFGVPRHSFLSRAFAYVQRLTFASGQTCKLRCWAPCTSDISAGSVRALAGTYGGGA